ncbi:MAG: leucine-rich repeat protein [Lachnospiraceae bacterium]|nr:leucine-rich repeat protein [Lachnospiraceae bacterium]
MIKRILKGLIGVILTFSMIFGTAFINSSFYRMCIENIAYGESGSYSYIVGNAAYTYQVRSDGSIYIEEYKGTDSKVVIPESINGKKVTAIGVHAFAECKTLEEVVIPDTVTEICAWSFADCSNLKKVKISNNAEYIGGSAFMYCSSLTGIEIPDSITEIYDYAFAYCPIILYCKNNLYVKKYAEENYIMCMDDFSMEESDQIYKERLDEVLSTVKSNMSDVEKVLAIHDWIVKKCQYDYDNYIQDTIPYISYFKEGVLRRGIAVCNGYANAMKFLLEKVGIESYIVSSYDMEHAWNIVKVDGKWYHVDATWDDPVGEKDDYVIHTYFLKSDDEIKKLNHYGWNEDAEKCTDSNSFNGYLFRIYSQNSFRYYNGYWYFSNGTYKGLINGQNITEVLDEIIYGDVNGDEGVDIKDSALIKRYLAGWEVDMNMEAADMDSDGDVTIKDSALIKRQLAGWE